MPSSRRAYPALPGPLQGSPQAPRQRARRDVRSDAAVLFRGDADLCASRAIQPARPRYSVALGV